MEVVHHLGILLRYLCYFILFVPVFVFLFLLGIVKVAVFCPFVFLVIAFGDTSVVIGLWPVHLLWTSYCIAKSKRFGPYMKCLLILTMPIPIAMWTVVGVVGSVIMGIFYAFIWPVMETFRAISQEGFINKLVRCFTDGTWSIVWGACTIVRDFADFSFHSYFSVMDELLEAKGDERPIELKVLQIPGCILAAILGVVVDVPMITLIVIYKAPIMLFKGWQRLLEDLIGRSGPFLEDVCVPFAGLLILLWPFAVLLAVLAGIISSFGFGAYAAVVAYQENSTKKGLLYVVASVSLFDEYTNDFLYLREGSCFPRLRYRDTVDASLPLLPVKGLHERLESVHSKQPPIRTASQKLKALKAVLIWDNFFEACELAGEELLRDGAIEIVDLEAWKHSKNKLFIIGLPAYAFLQCFLHSIKSGSPGFLMRDNVQLTNINRPEGRVFDWLFEPMSIMKEQIRSLNLQKTEELYLLKLALYSGDTQRQIVEAWENGGLPPNDEIRRAQLEGIIRRLHGFCLTLSRLPTFRRRFCVVVNALIQEAKQQSSGYGSENVIETVV
ncbi:hypothetical protein BVC80_1229g13 [Macleaya cordata]|uniref:Steroid nuclear receptor ligand-binding n=1 Tax=Macleaya cordata TaxID=56857 RepID=A0A200QYG3_MACCD|nr:hypothetical protein BVC80_1229g13 [Macleaya cordata]